MSFTKIQVRRQPLPRAPARNHSMIHSVVCGVSTKHHHRESNVLSRKSSPPLGSVPSRIDKRQFLSCDDNGKFGSFGGKFVPETLISRLRDLEDEFNLVLSNHEFQEEKRLDCPAAWLQPCGGSHRSRTTWGRHGGCMCKALLGAVFMGTTDIEKQFSNVLSMKQLGAQGLFRANLWAGECCPSTGAGMLSPRSGLEQLSLEITWIPAGLRVITDLTRQRVEVF